MDKGGLEVAYTTEGIRNIALVGHAGAGKTELNEALLHAAGKIPNRGSVDAGDTVSDFDPREQELKHSLRATFCHLDHGDTHVNLVDTPGYPDFQGRTLSVLPAVETAAVVVDAVAGVEPMTQQFMEAARAQGLCRMIVVNKIDAPNADAGAVLEQIQDAFGSECLPINLPAEDGTKVVDVFFESNGADPDFGSAEAAHEQIVDQVVEVDDDL
ncbi:MAG: GTP-binding protein, partial [Gammaproteobacteria bacterium]|nr:GTP-binding protein [Gammaproteobacteria bacterium]